MFTIYDGREYFYQWDLDRKLIVDDETIKQVHFCNKKDDCSLVCDVYTEGAQRLVNVPNIILQDDWRINVYGYDGQHTKHSESFDVKSRSKPADYIYTETEVKSFEALEQKVNDKLEQVDEFLNAQTEPKYELLKTYTIGANQSEAIMLSGIKLDAVTVRIKAPSGATNTSIRIYFKNNSTYLASHQIPVNGNQWTTLEVSNALGYWKFLYFYNGYTSNAGIYTQPRYFNVLSVDAYPYINAIQMNDCNNLTAGTTIEVYGVKKA